MAEMFLRRLTRWQAEQQRESFADLYVEAYAGVPGEEFRDRQEFLRRFAEHVQRPEFEFAVATGEELMGCAYGFRVSCSGEWWRGLGRTLSSREEELTASLEELTASGQVFVLAEMMVLPPYRRQHIATRLVDHLLVRSDAARAIALVGPGNVLARATFRSWSWTDLRATAEPGAAAEPGAPGAASDEPTPEVWSRLLPH
ncbi:GNAT family N-acetyltransferase [Actinacidiphila bryophytorum]|uniref:GNAT family N-acetyltransferase n=1 Tax=Actinacidiphila bryophytorum TaxID=1436133 RepID=UPI002176BA23|nr:GNAT family N-acetyltransferase [Actinacidiphila bryophytorum]UWE13350.1 GNAT family N-acetyltransferase [Actinacidiphila bryophytorum]